MNALKAVSLRSLPLEFSITMIITEIYTCKNEKTKKKKKKKKEREEKEKKPRFPSSKRP